MMMLVPDDAHRPMIVVRRVRGDHAEATHRVHAAVCDAKGRLVRGWGDVGTMVFPRSTAKPFQALPFASEAASGNFDLGAAEVALACASHHGQPEQVAILSRWLTRIGVGRDALRCGVQWPFCSIERKRLTTAGLTPDLLHNNNSGKHIAALTVCRVKGYPLKGYLSPEHPVQDDLARALERMSGFKRAARPAVDNCGMPTSALPLTSLATAYAGLACAEPGGPEHAVLTAVLSRPDLGSAPTALPARVMALARGACLVKSGSEGTYGASLVAQGLGLALKVEDGSNGMADAVLIRLLTALGILDEADALSLHPHGDSTIRNAAGARVGDVRMEIG